MARVLHFLTTPIGLVATILVPLLLVGLLILLDVIRNAYLAKLELDVVEEKRKITDESCVKQNVGYRISNKTKYKVLAQAEDDEKLLYLSLLWKDGTAPNALKKYCLQKQIYLHPVKQLLLLNRECEQMYKNGVDMEEIASHYSINKAKIEEKEKATNKRIRLMRKHYRQIVKKSKI